jgi:galacturan 1,4-alpha-galacturonidase
MINGPEWHNLVRLFWFYGAISHSPFQVNEGQNVVYNNIQINAGSTSKNTAKNTDGWNVYRSDNVTIMNSVIVNGDDCVAFKPSRYLAN